MNDEQILVAPRSVLEPFIRFRGFRQAGDSPIEEWIEAGGFKPRSMMESDPNYKQLIPYILLRCDDQVFRYWRTKRAGERRLHHLYSVGVGGHIDQRDDNLFTPSNELLLEAAMRELKEEIELSETPDLRHIGYINDDESEVGQVHFGVVYEAWLANPHAQTRESALARGEWKRLHDLKDVEYESWSQFLLDEYLLKT
ncbi:MAG: NUDIX domain-containing protein [Candidatus Omnitrophica bacterium]|nr:NUDIX domain-containing protein [Candidatus Omnitrophota bacterium]